MTDSAVTSCNESRPNRPRGLRPPWPFDSPKKVVIVARLLDEVLVPAAHAVPAPGAPASTSGRISTDQIQFKEMGRGPSGRDACVAGAQEACRILGLPETHWVPGMVTIAERESAFNAPQWQINTNDLNAKNVPELFGGGPAPDGHFGQCSRGAVQCIPQTFAEYHVAGTSLDIYNLVASVAAGIEYIIHRYGIQRDGSDLVTKPLGPFNGSENGFGIQQADPTRRPWGY